MARSTWLKTGETGWNSALILATLVLPLLFACTRSGFENMITSQYDATGMAEAAVLDTAVVDTAVVDTAVDRRFADLHFDIFQEDTRPDDLRHMEDAETSMLAIDSPSPSGRYLSNQPQQSVSGFCSFAVTSLAVNMGSLDDGDCSDGTWRLATMSFNEGDNVFVITGEGHLGDTLMAQLIITIDTVPPDVAITSPSADAVYATNTTTHVLSGTCSMDVVGLSSSVGSFSDADCSDGQWALNLTTLAEGDTDMVIEASDAAGNTNSDTLHFVVDLPPSVTITAPNNGGDYTIYTPTVVVRGSCSEDVVLLTSTLGTFDDADCSDSNWSLTAFTMGYPLQSHYFAVDVQDSFGSTASDTIRVTHAYIRLENGAVQIYRRYNPTTISGKCSTEVTNLVSDRGTITDADCSDQSLSIQLPFDSGEGDYRINVTATDSLGQTELDSLLVHYDTTPPEPPVLTETTPASPNEDNFPRVRGEYNDSESAQLFADAACTLAIGGHLATFDDSLRNGSFGIVVADGTTTPIYAQSIDVAGNVSACSPTPLLYTDSSTLTPPACDVNVNTNMSFAALQLMLDDAELNRSMYLADDGLVSVCLGDGVSITTTSVGEGARLQIPGDDFRLGAATGRALLRNSRADAVPDEATARGVLAVMQRNNFGLFALDLETTADNASALAASGSTIAFLRDLNLRASASTGTALSLNGSYGLVKLAELSRSVLVGRTALYTRAANIRMIDSCTFRFYGGAGIYLHNASILVTELIDSFVGSEHPTAGGTALIFWSANRDVSIERMQRTTFARGAAASVSSGTVMSFSLYPNDHTYVRTQNTTDNVVCWAGAGAWTTLINNGDLPTVPYDTAHNSSSNGARSFPWGDASDAAANPGNNLQALWGGVCP